ncbi:MAG: TRAP transporter small permease subunit [Burkholderiales bacterium]|nr:MAG: TRAP transporter small permease subunit [Betaproteobacteria bacterium]TAG24925.1 MAG: TRAP transporter small permease subunit [Burkholderiales bacterium]TAG47867.1 MAG: TRAP transporter small permease subunit [Betaproteobacteria bacterium]
MNALLSVSKLIDAMSTWVGKTIRWLILIVVLISASNAIIRKAFDISSNAWLEVQWYLFAAVFLLGAGYVFLVNAHVRIDFISTRLTARARNWIDVLGIVLFLIPLCIIVIKLSWPLFYNAYVSGETSQNAGGLIRWPVFLMMPLGFTLLLLQGVSELIKRIAFLRGAAPDSLADRDEKTDEEKLLEALAAETAQKEQDRLKALAAETQKGGK